MVVASPGVSSVARGVAVTSKVRDAGGTDSVILPTAYAGRCGTSVATVPSSLVRAVAPTTSRFSDNCGTSASVIGTVTTALPSTTWKRIVSRMPLRLTVTNPSPVANGACTNSSAVSPTAYVSCEGTTVRTCWSTPRVGWLSAPLTHAVVSVRLRPPRSSVTTAVTLYCPPRAVSNVQTTASAVEVTVQVCGSSTTSVHSPSTYFDSMRPATTSTDTPLRTSPSMPVTIVSISRGSPWRTKALVARNPT